LRAANALEAEKVDRRTPPLGHFVHMGVDFLLDQRAEGPERPMKHLSCVFDAYSISGERAFCASLNWLGDRAWVGEG